MNGEIALGKQAQVPWYEAEQRATKVTFIKASNKHCPEVGAKTMDHIWLHGVPATPHESPIEKTELRLVRE